MYRRGSSYENLNKTLTKFFDKNEGASIGTNSQEAQEIIKKVELCLSLTLMFPSMKLSTLYSESFLSKKTSRQRTQYYEEIPKPRCRLSAL